MPKRTAAEASFDSQQVEGSATSKKLKTGSDNLVGKVNGLRPEDFRSTYVKEDWLHYQPRGLPLLFDVDSVAADDLKASDFDACFNHVETTSRSDYEASNQGWRPRNKRREMKDHDMHYLLVRQLHPRQTPIESVSDVCGFLSFMVTHDSTPAVPALYVYEIHLSNRLQGIGLGAHLLGVAENLSLIHI